MKKHIKKLVIIRVMLIVLGSSMFFIAIWLKGKDNFDGNVLNFMGIICWTLQLILGFEKPKINNKLYNTI